MTKLVTKSSEKIPITEVTYDELNQLLSEKISSGDFPETVVPVLPAKEEPEEVAAAEEEPKEEVEEEEPA